MGNCQLCGAKEETRPYGPNGESVCFGCGMLDEAAAERAFVRLIRAPVVLVGEGHSPVPFDPRVVDVDGKCDACGVGSPENECPKSMRGCGHHCNHSWSHDACCWCATEFGEEPP